MFLNTFAFKVSALELNYWDCSEASWSLNYLRQEGNVKSIMLSDADIRPEDMNDVVTLIRNNPRVAKIDLSNNSLNEADVLMLAETLKNCTHLKSLNLENCGLTFPAIETIVQSLKEKKDLEHINIGYNGGEIDDNPEWESLLAEVIRGCPDFNSLSLIGLPVRNRGLISLFKALSGNNELRELNFQTNSTEIVDALANLIHNSPKLESLEAKIEGLTHEQALNLLEKVHSPLKRLNLKIHDHDGEDPQNIVNVLLNIPTLENINLSDLFLIDVGGANAIETLLKKHPAIKKIRMNFTSSAERQKILRAFGTAIKSFYFGDCLEDKDYQILTEKIKNKTFLPEEIEFGYSAGFNKPSTKATIPFFASLKSLPKLRRLHLSPCQEPHNAVVQSLAEILKTKKTLVDFSLMSTNMSAENISHLAEALELNTRLEILNLHLESANDELFQKAVKKIGAHLSLKHITLHFYGTWEDKIKILLEALESSPNIENVKINYWNYDLNNEEAQETQNAFREYLKELRYTHIKFSIL